MKNLISPLILVAILLSMLSACDSAGTATVSPEALKAKVDSLVEVQTMALKDSFNMVCEKRQETEIMAKVDSLMNASKTEDEK